MKFKKFKWIFLCVFGLILLFPSFQSNYLKIKKSKSCKTFNKLPDIALENENQKIKDILNSTFPKEDNILYEDPYRLYNIKPTYKVYGLSDIITLGKDLVFEKVYSNNEYARPIYSSDWKNFYFRGWLELDSKISEAHHKLFVYYGGASNIFDFEGSLGFSENINVDYHRNINFLVYQFNVKQIIMYENQITLIGTPSSEGAETIAIHVNAILPKDIDRKEFLFQLSTPNGYEIDFDYGYYYRSDYLKKLMEEGIAEAFSHNAKLSIQEDLLKQNILLKKELSNYIPLEDDIRITKQGVTYPSTTEIQNLIAGGSSINFNISYQDNTYKRPIFDPIWEENFREGWAYLPVKMSENMDQLFILPANNEDQMELLSRLGFHEKYNPIPSKESSLLIYNFDIEKMIILDSLIGIIGTPSRTGVSIVSFPRKEFTERKNHSILLLTPDYYVLE